MLGVFFICENLLKGSFMNISRRFYEYNRIIMWNTEGDDG